MSEVWLTKDSLSHTLCLISAGCDGKKMADRPIYCLAVQILITMADMTVLHWLLRAGDELRTHHRVCSHPSLHADHVLLRPG